jgi:hypothetical protein
MLIDQFQLVNVTVGHPDVGSTNSSTRRQAGAASAWAARATVTVNTANDVCQTISSPSFRMREDEYPAKPVTVIP